MEKELPISTIHLFPILDQKLIELLRSLTPEEWNLPTIAKKWVVKDIAAHLLDGNIRTLSFSRDKHQWVPDKEINNYQDLVDYLNELNAQWVTALKRVSPGMLVDLLESTGKEYSAYISTLKPFDDAIFSVAWAGEQVSKNWFHIAREYTEKFIHQQQIRDAVGKPGLMTKELFYPFIDTFMRALPFTYRNVRAGEGAMVKVIVTSEIGGEWFLKYSLGKWHLVPTQNEADVTASCSLDPGTAWRLFSKGITADEARMKVELSGEKELGAQVLRMVSVMA